MNKMSAFRNRVSDFIKEYRTRVGEINFIFTLVVFFAVVIKFSLFYQLVNVTANLIPVLVVSCSITFLLLTGFRNKWLGVTLYLVISVFMFCDITYYSFFNRYLSLSMLGAAGVVGEIGESIKEVIRPLNFLVFFDVAILYVWLIKSKTRFGQEKRMGKVSYRNPVIIVVLTGLIISNFPGSNFLTSVSNQEIYSFRIKDALANTVGTKINQGAVFSGEYHRQKNGPLFGVAEGRNLIVIQLESVQNFVIGLEYNGQEVTPNLNKLIESNSIYFDNYYQQTGGGNTSDAEFATNNSIMGDVKSYTYKNHTDNHYRGLPVLLKEKGYETAVFHAYEFRDFWTRDAIYPNLGFDRFYGGMINDTQNRPDGDYRMTEWMGWGLTDTEFYKQTVPFMEQLKEPFYSFVISLSNHHPYIMLEQYNFIELLPEDRDTLAGNYLNSAAYTDHALGEFLEALKEDGLYDRSVIAIYGDHSGLVNSEETDQVMGRILGKPYDFDEVMSVPLIINLPENGMDIRQRVSLAGGQLDFLPTISYLMGFDQLDTVYLGQNLLTADRGFVAEHTYMLEGSFFTDTIAFEMSRDGLFENGRAWNIKTGEPVSLEGLEEKYEKSVEISLTSQFILEKDVLAGIYLENMTINEAFKQ